MPLVFYPDDIQKDTLSLEERIEVLMDAAERYKAIVLDKKPMKTEDPAKPDDSGELKLLTPRDLVAVFNWEEVARALRDIRELPEADKADKTLKADLLTKLAEVYEILRAAKLVKLEAVRIALITEANHLRGGI
ncbi:MAG: hypothetical protein JO149_07575 [Gammaproteobacteria bacterium]|nr:hypothetical protein [Gammaproteobacteria bacterium]